MMVERAVLSTTTQPTVTTASVTSDQTIAILPSVTTNQAVTMLPSRHHQSGHNYAIISH